LRLRLETIHFHLRTNVEGAAAYERALAEIVAICRAAEFAPKHLDAGGGYPAPYVRSLKRRPYDEDFRVAAMADVYTRTLKQLPSVREIWLENGRFVTARSGVLVVRVLDIKERGEVRFLICDGGRTLHGLVSTWETHDLFSVPMRRGPRQLTTVCGPTCMAFDQLVRCPLPRSIRAGDALVWMDAGAYHIPWETRFSHGHCAVLWHQDGQIALVRKPQSFEQWWAQW
jgi:diaminopimelate decarboxylase